MLLELRRLGGAADRTAVREVELAAVQGVDITNRDCTV